MSVISKQVELTEMSYKKYVFKHFQTIHNVYHFLVLSLNCATARLLE